MKIFFLNIILLSSSFSGCKDQPKFYEGYIYTKEKKPVGNIKVCDLHRENCSETDGNGFF